MKKSRKLYTIQKMPTYPRISKLKESLKNPTYVDEEATFQKKSKRSSSKSPKRASSVSPKRSSSVSPKRSSSVSPKRVDVLELPGEVPKEQFEFRAVVSRPSAEKYANMEILKKNPTVTMEELSMILGATKISLPKIETKMKPIELPTMKVSSPKRTPKSPQKESSKAKSPKRESKKKCGVMLRGKPIDKSMISMERSSKAKPVYKIEELKEIAKQLLLSSTGTKDVLVTSILAELENRGC